MRAIEKYKARTKQQQQQQQHVQSLIIILIKSGLYFWH